MELFLPSLFIFLLSAAVVIAIVPRLSPILIVLFAGVLLAFGVYHHFSLFWNEYRLSTWQEQLKIFAPGIMIAAIIVYLLIAIISFFTGAKVPAPSMPSIVLPPANTATNMVTSTINNILQNAVPANKINSAEASVNAQPSANRNEQSQTNQTNQTKNVNNSKGANNITRSFFDVI